MAASNHKCISHEELQRLAYNLWNQTPRLYREAVFVTKLKTIARHPPECCSECSATWSLKISRVLTENHPELAMKDIVHRAAYQRKTMWSWEDELLEEVFSARITDLPTEIDLNHRCKQSDIDHIESWAVNLWKETTGEYREFFFYNKINAAFGHEPENMCDNCCDKRTEIFMNLRKNRNFVVDATETLDMKEIYKKCEDQSDDAVSSMYPEDLDKIYETRVTIKI